MGYKEEMLFINKPDKSALSINPFMNLADYKKQKDVCIIQKADIANEERKG